VIVIAAPGLMPKLHQKEKIHKKKRKKLRPKANPITNGACITKSGVVVIQTTLFARYSASAFIVWSSSSSSTPYACTITSSACL